MNISPQDLVSHYASIERMVVLVLEGLGLVDDYFQGESSWLGLRVGKGG